MADTGKRILIVDTLRGFALLLIVLIHFVEHFELYYPPEVNFLFSKETDQKVFEMVFGLISGKAYSIFALLFGLSFFIQLDNAERKGVDYRWGFAWRMVILLLFGMVHSLIYRGDILHMYAILSFPLILLYRINSKILLTIAVLLVIQIPAIIELTKSFIVPDYVFVQKIPSYWHEGNEAYMNSSLTNVIKYNFWKGRMTVWGWSYYVGRVYQLFALFIIGLLLGRKRIFENVPRYRKAFIVSLIVSLIAFLVFYLLNINLQNPEYSKVQNNFINTIITSYENLAITYAMISLMVVLYSFFREGAFFRYLAAYGKMSLTNYIAQAIFGVIFFYGFGLGMYKYLGSTWSLLLSLIVFFLQAQISMYWNKYFNYGPLEWLWRCLTKLDFSVPLRRKT